VGIARLHLITPDALDASVLQRTRAALVAGAPWLQVRTKRASDRERLAFATAMRDLCAELGAACLIDDRVDVALAVRAIGVHVGADDLPAGTARKLLGSSAVVGVTCRNAEDARRALDDGATYLGVGPVYATSTKVGLPAPIGLAGLEAVAAAVDLPLIAISGITVERVHDVLEAGAHGVGVVSSVFDADDVGAATKAFLHALGEPIRSPLVGDDLGALAGAALGTRGAGVEG